MKIEVKNLLPYDPPLDTPQWTIWAELDFERGDELRTGLLVETPLGCGVVFCWHPVAPHWIKAQPMLTEMAVRDLYEVRMN